MARTTREVVEAHLALRRAGDLERDLELNYHDDVVLLSGGEGVHHGKDGVRHLAAILRTYLPDARYEYQEVLVDDAYAMLLWRGRSHDVSVHDGADSYVVRGGLIIAQTIHYSTRPVTRHDE